MIKGIIKGIIIVLIKGIIKGIIKGLIKGTSIQPHKDHGRSVDSLTEKGIFGNN